jgi:Fic family protein
MDWQKLTVKKELLDKYRPVPKDLLNNLQQWLKVELTYSSNAIEGNTLTHMETALIIEKGITIGGKSLTEHLEAVNHAAAFDLMQKIVRSKTHKISENDILEIHRTLLKTLDDTNAGRYRRVAVRILGSEVISPNAAKVPTLMHDFFGWLTQHQNLHPVELAADAHLHLVTIHPFVDGNGRTARLLLDAILLQNDYAPALIRKQDRLTYLKSLEMAQLTGDKSNYYNFIYKAVMRGLDFYLDNLQNKETSTLKGKLIKIGELAKRANLPIATIRYWTSLGLLEVADHTAGGYALYTHDIIERIKHIQELQQKRFTLQEIKSKIDVTTNI